RSSPSSSTAVSAASGAATTSIFRWLSKTPFTRSTFDDATGGGAGASSVSRKSVSSTGATAVAANDDPAGRELAGGLTLLEPAELLPEPPVVFAGDVSLPALFASEASR